MNSEAQSSVPFVLSNRAGRTVGEFGASAEPIVITNGSPPLLALRTEALVDPGDMVITGGPSYFPKASNGWRRQSERWIDDREVDEKDIGDALQTGSSPTACDSGVMDPKGLPAFNRICPQGSFQVGQIANSAHAILLGDRTLTAVVNLQPFRFRLMIGPCQKLVEIRHMALPQ